MGEIPRPLLTNRFTEAIDFALVAHCAQVRKGTHIPYLSHLLAVASLVIEHDGDEDAAVAAVLHDAPEDQGGQAMVEQIHARFGSTPTQSGWYYGRLERALDERLAAHDGREMVMELTHALDAITALPGCEAFGAGLALGRGGGACPPDDERHPRLTS